MLSLHDSLPICLPSTCARATQKPVSGGKIRAFLDYRSKPCPIRCWTTISRMRQAAMLISTRWRHERYDVHATATAEPPSGVARSEERRVGSECICTCRSRGTPYHNKKHSTTH